MMRAVVEGLLTSTLHQDFLSILVASRVIVLYKNGSEALRPISIPSVFRKAAGTAASLMYKQELRAVVPEYQFGCGQSHGTSLLAAHVTSLYEHIGSGATLTWTYSTPSPPSIAQWFDGL